MQVDCSYVSVIQNNDNNKVFQSDNTVTTGVGGGGGEGEREGVERPDQLSDLLEFWCTGSWSGGGSRGFGGDEEFPVCGLEEERKEEMHRRENT